MIIVASLSGCCVKPLFTFQSSKMPQELFHVITLEKVTVVELTLPPALDSDEFDHLNASLLKLIGDQPDGRWVVDLSQLSYMGSAALGLMVNLRQQVKDAGGMLVLCGMSSKLAGIFRTCCLERLFTIRGSRDDALRTVK